MQRHEQEHQRVSSPRDDLAKNDPVVLTSTLLFLMISVLTFILIKRGTEYVAWTAPEMITVWAMVIGCGSVPFLLISYEPMSLFVRRLLRASAVFLIVYFAVEPFDIPYAAFSRDHAAVVFHERGRWIGLFLAIIGLWRPVAVFMSTMLLWMIRDLQGTLTGFYFSVLDIRTVVEMIAFCAAGLILIAASLRVSRVKDALALTPHIAWHAGLVIVAAGIGGHLGNYLFSGLAKFSLDGGVVSWLFENRLYDGMLGAIEKGTMPFAASAALTQVAYDVVKDFNVSLELLSVIMQLAALVAPARRKWLIAITLVYVVFHIVVYVFFGLLFWKWVALNMVIVVTLFTVTDAQWKHVARIVCIVFVLIGPLFFRTATLAWYDAPAFTSVFFEVVMKDGTRYRVPNAYFNTASYQVSQGRIFMPANTEHFNFSIWGSVLHWADLEAARACQPPRRSTPTLPRYGPLPAVSAYVKAHHAQVLERVNDNGMFNYYLVPHHHMPSPFLDDPFYRVDKRSIVSYVYIVESICLDIQEGHLKRDVVARSEFSVFDVATSE